MRKLISRIILISSNTVRQLLKSVFGFVIAFLVIKYANKEIWGEFVAYMLFVLFAEQVVSWGNKEFLLREFSKNPSAIKTTWTSVLLIRFPLVILLSVISIIFFKTTFLYIFIWLTGRFLAQSSQPLIVYTKKFNQAIFIELISFFIFFIIFFFQKNNITLAKLLELIAVYHLLKGSLYGISYSTYFKLKNNINFKYFRIALPFFIMAILGFVASKIDLYLVNYFLNKTEIANYQIINAGLLFIQSLALFIYTPFIKNIYRINSKTIHKIQVLISKIGLFVIPILLVALYIITVHFYEFTMPISFLILGFLITFPSYYFGILIIKMLGEYHEQLVAKIIGFGILVNLIVSYSLLSLKFGILGVLIGMALSQFIMLLLIHKQSNLLK